MENDFLVRFAKYPDEALIGVCEIALLLHTSGAAVYKRVQRGTAPPPCSRTGVQKQLRWRVGEVRGWLNKLPVDAAEEMSKAKIGRPRTKVVVAAAAASSEGGAA